MTLENTPVDTAPEGDSPVIQALRTQIKDLEKDLKSRPDRETLEAEIRAEQARKEAISEQLIALGQPKGMSEVLAARLPEGEVTADVVKSQLQSLGFEIEAGSDEPVDGTSSEDQALAKVSSLSSEVSSASQNAPADQTMTKINEAGSLEEIAAAAKEAGFATQYM